MILSSVFCFKFNPPNVTAVGIKVIEPIDTYGSLPPPHPGKNPYLHGKQESAQVSSSPLMTGKI